MLTIALSKGRIFQETLPLLQGAGIECKENPETSRKLILNTNNKNIRLLIVRASDVPTYVECGGADIGIARCLNVRGRDIGHLRGSSSCFGAIEDDSHKASPGTIDILIGIAVSDPVVLSGIGEGEVGNPSEVC